MAQKALLVGINKYPDPRNKLNGCVNDIKDMASFLTKKCGFQSDDIRLIVDERATANNIKERLNWLVSDLQAGDRIFFQYSGHGAVLPIRSGKGKVSQLFECICPYDFNWTADTSVRDIDFAEIFNVIPDGVEFVWISDSCHSGGLVDERGIMENEGQIPRQFYVPEDLAWRIVTAQALSIVSQSFRDIAKRINAVLVAACKATQTAADAYFNGKPNGALTYFLLKALEDNTIFSQPLTFVTGKVIEDLKNNRYSQIPQLEGNDTMKEKAFLQI
jgi:hypothetical protein